MMHERLLSDSWVIFSLEDGSCCSRAVRFFASQYMLGIPKIVYFSSFKEMVKAARECSEPLLLLLPHLHSIIAELETSSEFVLLKEYVVRIPNPPLYLASRSFSINNTGICASIDQLRGLLDVFPSYKNVEFLKVPSTQAAARACKDGLAEMCITNLEGTGKYDLKTMQKLKHINVWWFPYIKFKQHSELLMSNKMSNESSNISVLIVNHSIDASGVLINAAFVLGLTAGRSMSDDLFGDAVSDAQGRLHVSLTNIAHFVRKASPNKIRTLREQLVNTPNVHVVDYPEVAGTSDYALYSEKMSMIDTAEVEYRAIHVFGPRSVVEPVTKNLKRA